jgi:hypothetical protein
VITANCRPNEPLLKTPKQGLLRAISGQVSARRVGIRQIATAADESRECRCVLAASHHIVLIHVMFALGAAAIVRRHEHAVPVQPRYSMITTPSSPALCRHSSSVLSGSGPGPKPLQQPGNWLRSNAVEERSEMVDINPTDLKADVKELLADATDVVGVLADLDDLPGLDKIKHFVTDAQIVLADVEDFLDA